MNAKDIAIIANKNGSAAWSLDKNSNDIIIKNTERLINKYANSKLKRVIGEIGKWKSATQHFGTSYQIINDIIEIIEKEIK